MARKKPTSRAHRILLSRRRTAVRVIKLRPDAESVGYVGSQPHTHGGTCGDNLNTTLILHPDLFNITHMPRGETVKELGSNMASFSNLTGVFSAPREITAFENHEPRHLRSLMYGDNLYSAQQSRQIPSFPLPILLNKDYSDVRMWSFTAHTPPIHFMLNNYNDCIKGDTTSDDPLRLLGSLTPSTLYGFCSYTLRLLMHGKYSTRVRLLPQIYDFPHGHV